MTLLGFPSTPSSLSTLFVKQKLPQGVCPSLRPRIVLVAMALSLSMSVAPAHADTVPLSILIANPNAEITGPGGLVYGHFTFSSLDSPSQLNDISVVTDSVSATQSRIQFGPFTGPPQMLRSAGITYQVTSTIGPITDFHLVAPSAVEGASPRAFADAGAVVEADVIGVGATLLTGDGGFFGGDRALLGLPPLLGPPTFPSGLATLAVVTGIQIDGGDTGPSTGGGPNATLTLPHFDNVYTVTVVPEPSTSLLLASGLIALMLLSRFIRLQCHP